MGVLLLVCVLTAVPELQEWCDLKRWQLDAELLGVAHGMGQVSAVGCRVWSCESSGAESSASPQQGEFSQLPCGDPPSLGMSNCTAVWSGVMCWYGNVSQPLLLNTNIKPVRVHLNVFSPASKGTAGLTSKISPRCYYFALNLISSCWSQSYISADKDQGKLPGIYWRPHPGLSVTVFT